MISTANVRDFGAIGDGVTDDTLFKGAMRERIRDMGGHVDSQIGPNPGCLKDPNDLDS
jgi:hypothetical protein